jgi:Concanavalin A-like lectin/glucanases superfamily
MKSLKFGSALVCILILAAGAAPGCGGDDASEQPGDAGGGGRAGAGGSGGRAGSGGANTGGAGRGGTGGAGVSGGSGGGTGGASGAGGLDASAEGGATGGTSGAGGNGGSGGTAESGGSPVDAGTGGGAGAGGSPLDGSTYCPTCSTDLALYWKFDEESGTAAIDSSGNNFNGTYVGVVGSPTPSTSIPPISFSDPYTRAFNLNNQQAVELASAPSILKPANNLTISVWYKATQTDTTGSEIVSLGDIYILRLKSTFVEWTKYIASGNTGKWVHCDAYTNLLDGNWHHIAALTSPAGMSVYFDGVRQCDEPTLGQDIIYTKGNDLFVGRHGTQKPNFDFDGNIDEVRIYTRALSVDEIVSLALGGSSEVLPPDAGASDAGEEAATPDAAEAGSLPDVEAPDTGAGGASDAGEDGAGGGAGSAGSDLDAGDEDGGATVIEGGGSGGAGGGAGGDDGGSEGGDGGSEGGAGSNVDAGAD